MAAILRAYKQRRKEVRAFIASEGAELPILKRAVKQHLRQLKTQPSPTSVVGGDPNSPFTPFSQAADALLSHMQTKYQRYDLAISEILDMKDFRAFVSVDKAETTVMRLHAKLTGRLQQNPSKRTSQIVIGDKSPGS
jgi:hypothetical protein